MSINIFGTMDIMEVMENFLEMKRPPENIRHQLDLGYKIENQSIIIYEIRPAFHNPSEKIECPVAKTTFVKSKNHWKVFWMRGDLKWHQYGPKPVVKTLKAFIKLLDEDEYSCFWG